MRNKRAIISQVYKEIKQEQSSSVDRDSLYSRGLAYEGYAGGYLQALSDVNLILGGDIPNSRYESIWKKVIQIWRQNERFYQNY